MADTIQQMSNIRRLLPLSRFLFATSAATIAIAIGRIYEARPSKQPGCVQLENLKRSINDGHSGPKPGWPLREHHPALQLESAKLVEHSCAPRDKSVTHSMDRLHIELVVRLDRNENACPCVHPPLWRERPIWPRFVPEN